MAKYLDENGLLYYNQKLDTKFNNKVDKEEGKGLSEKNFTSTYEQKLKSLENYELPTASTDTLGGVKVGAGLSINGSGVLSATGGGTADAVDWANVQSKPTTISGYGITDAKIEGQVVTLGSNSVTVPTNNNQLTNGAGYQTASDVSSAISSALADVTGIEYQIVEDLPQTGEKGVIYLISNDGTGNNIYDEYIWTGTAFEKIGTTAVDLSNYWSKTELTAIQNGDIDSIMSGA